jgi:glycosyltransferase involved in cell wall biosynthesis
MKMTGVAGAENHLLTLLPGIANCGIRTHLLILTEPDYPMDEYAAEMTRLGVPTEQMLIERDVDMPLFRRLNHYIKEGGFDAVHTHLIHADLHGITAAIQAGVKYIYMSGHNDDPFRRRLPIRAMQNLLWRRITRGIAISEAVRQFMIKVEGAPPTKAVTIHYGLDLKKHAVGVGARQIFRHELGLPEQTPVFGSVCRLIEQKGLSDSLRAFWQISRQVPEAQYVLVGDGPLRAELEREVDAYHLRHRVHFLGWRKDAQAMISAFDALVMPSKWEGFGLVALEAMAVRTPVIATMVSALPEIVIDGETGFLVQSGDVEGLSQAMMDICQYPQESRQMGVAGRERLETHFSAASMIQKTAELYQETAKPS